MMSNSRTKWLSVALCGGMLATTASLSAQVYGAPLPGASRRNAGIFDAPAHVFTTNPLALLAGWFSAEFEQRANASAGVVVGLSYYDFEDFRSTSGEAKLRLYPEEHAPRGINMGSSIGFSVLHYKPASLADCEELDTPRCVDRNGFHDVTTPTFGVDVGNQWMLGAHRRTAVSVGVGAKRYLVSRRDMPGKERLTATVRFGVGYGF